MERSVNRNGGKSKGVSAGRTNTNGSNVNEEGYVERDPYYEKNEAEAKKVPVEYLGHLRKSRQKHLQSFFTWVIVLGILFGIGPSTTRQEFCPECGMWQTQYSLAWGQISFKSLPTESEWTRWFDSKNPVGHEHRWLPAGKIKNGLFNLLNFPWADDLGWNIPANMTQRMKELEPEFRLARVFIIPRVLGAVNNADEWNAIVLPLCIGTKDDALKWWNAHEDMLVTWSEQPDGTPLDPQYITDAEEYVDKMTHPGETMPLM